MINLGKGQAYKIGVTEGKFEYASFALIIIPDDEENWVELYLKVDKSDESQEDFVYIPVLTCKSGTFLEFIEKLGNIVREAEKCIKRG